MSDTALPRLFLDIRRSEADHLAVSAQQFEPVRRGLLENALILLPGFRLYDRRAVANGDFRRGFQNCADQFATRKFVADREQIRPGLAAAAIYRMTPDARGPLLVIKQIPPMRGAAVVPHRKIAKFFQRRNWSGLARGGR